MQIHNTLKNKDSFFKKIDFTALIVKTKGKFSQMSQINKNADKCRDTICIFACGFQCVSLPTVLRVASASLLTVLILGSKDAPATLQTGFTGIFYF